MLYLITHEYVIVLIVVLLSFYLMWKNRKIEAIEIFSASVLVSGVGMLLKSIWKIPRPTNALVTLESYAYPSLHSAWIVCICALIYILWIRKLSKKRIVIVVDIILGLLIVGIGASRIWLGVHTVEDVVGGYSLGLIVALLVFVTFRLAQGRKS